ncbi:MAG TPA: radical SAM protein [Myxococcota bacterium]|nr:radical SAM protein [Myxococcota bacterium]
MTLGTNHGARRALFVYTSAQAEYLAAARHAELSMKKVPHLGFLYLAAVLKENGIDCQVMDRTLDRFGPDELAAKARNEGLVFVGFYSDSITRDAVCHWIVKLRAAAPELPILVGGADAYRPEPYLNAGATMVCTGEGEEAIVEMIRAIDGELDPREIDGIAFSVDGSIVINPARQPIADLDSIPFPRRDIIDIDRYHDWRVLGMRKPYTTMITSRGCHRRCTFCSVPFVSGRTVRLRSAANVLCEIDELVRDFGIRYITFKDDYFAVDPDWEREFCEGLIERGYDLKWTCQTHPSVFEKDRGQRLERFRRAGCDLLIFGLQSTDPDILKAIRRSPREPEIVAANVAAARKIGLQTVVEFICGLPGWSRATLEADVRFALKVRPQYAAFYPLMRLDPSELFEQFGIDGDMCGLSNRELNRLGAWAYRRFYLDPRILFPTVWFVLKDNPLWIRHGLGFLAGQLFPWFRPAGRLAKVR